MINISDLLEQGIDKPLNGITDYFSKKTENLTNGFVRSFTLSNEEKMTFINDIYVDRCYSISDKNPCSAPMHNLDNNSVIAETVKKEPTNWNLQCKFTSADHKEKYEKLLNLRETSTLVTLMFNGKVIENLAILDISRTINNVFYTEFTLSLSKLTFVKVSVIPSPVAEKIVSENKTVNTGKEPTEKEVSSPNKENLIKVIDPLGMWAGKGADTYIMNEIGGK